VLQSRHLADTGLVRIKKTPVPTAVPADIAEVQLPGSGATLLYYAPAGSRAKGHPGANRKIAQTATTVMAAPVLIACPPHAMG
jgi:hypothetical protein